MKTQCPECKQLWNIEAGEQGQTIVCFYCKATFAAAPYLGAAPQEPPAIPFQPSQTTQPYEEIGCPGLIWYVIGAAGGLFGIIMGLVEARRSLSILISAVMFWLICSAIGGVLNRLERIAHHTEKMRDEINHKKAEDS